MKNVLSEATMVPLGLVVSVIITLLGGVGFVTFVAFQTNTNTKSIEKLESKQEAISAMALDIALIKNDINNMAKAMEELKKPK